MKRGEIYYADLSPVVGSEQGGMRPVVIVQNDIGNKYSPTTIAVPLTTQNKANLPTHCEVHFIKPSLVLCEQVKVLDKSRLREYAGRLTQEEMKQVDKALKISLGV